MVFSLIPASPYDPSASFSMGSLFKLEEGAGIKVVSSLAKIPAQLASAAGIDLQEHVMELTDKNKRVELIIDQWKAGDSQRPATWKSLLSILQELGLEELSHEIEDYMHGEQSITTCSIRSSRLHDPLPKEINTDHIGHGCMSMRDHTSKSTSGLCLSVIKVIVRALLFWVKGCSLGCTHWLFP